MLPITPDEVKRWRCEIQAAEDFRSENFGDYTRGNYRFAGENIDYFERGISSRFQMDSDLMGQLQTINLVYPIVKNVIPTLYWKNPYINCIPKRLEDEPTAPFVGAILNYYYDELDVKNTNRQIIFDAYVLGMGICKIGYATQFGADIPDENIEKEREKRKQRGWLEKLGLRKPKEGNEDKTAENVELDEFIRSESPYISWVNPFEFLIDPSATSINNARWVAQKITKILKQVKENKAYKNTSQLTGTVMRENLTNDVPETQIDNFKTIDLYEIHYKTDGGINILTLAKDQEDFKDLRHEENPYDMDGFQFEVIAFNKHSHKLYPKSDVDIFKGLQDRIAITFDNILDQIDKYVPKLLVDETGLTEDGKRALRDGEVGSIVYTTKNPQEVVREASFTQLKTDLAVFIDKLFDIVMLETGLTRAQLMGMSNAQTATEAQISQAGQNLRLSDKFDLVADFANKQARKLWQVVQKFVDLEEVQLITGDKGIDDVTGLPKFSWMPGIDSELAEKMRKGEYRFKIEVGALEKPDLPILRQQFERMGQLLAGNGVMLAFERQGYKIELAEIFKLYLKLFPDAILDPGKIIKPITPNTQGLLGGQRGAPPQQGGAPPQFRQAPMNPPNIADILSGASGEKGQGVVPMA